MKTLVISMIAFLAGTSAFAADLKVSCVVNMNTEKALETVIKPAIGGYTDIGQTEGYRFRIRNNDGSRVSLEIFDIDGEARYYADATLKEANDAVTNTIWRRDLLLEVNCQVPQ